MVCKLSLYKADVKKSLQVSHYISINVLQTLKVENILHM